MGLNMVSKDRRGGTGPGPGARGSGVGVEGEDFSSCSWTSSCCALAGSPGWPGGVDHEGSPQGSAPGSKSSGGCVSLGPRGSGPTNHCSVAILGAGGGDPSSLSLHHSRWLRVRPRPGNSGFTWAGSAAQANSPLPRLLCGRRTARRGFACFEFQHAGGACRSRRR